MPTANNLVNSFSLFSECGCSIEGSENEGCDDPSGMCTCKENFTDLKCDRCNNGFYEYPVCRGMKNYL